MRRVISFYPFVGFKTLQVPQRSTLKCKLHSNASDKRIGDIVVKRFNPDDYQKLSDFLLRNFFEQEPMGNALGLKVENELKSWFHKYVKAQLSGSPPVSTQAVDVKTNELAGVNFAIIFDPSQSSKGPALTDFINPAKQPVFSLICRFLSELEEGIDAAELLGLKSIAETEVPKTVSHLMMCVSEKYKKRGLSHELLMKTEELASKVKMCKVAQVVTTSEFSYKVFLKHEYQVIREFQYPKYVDAVMSQIFSGKEQKLGEHLAARVLIKQIVNQRDLESKATNKT